MKIIWNWNVHWLPFYFLYKYNTRFVGKMTFPNCFLGYKMLYSVFVIHQWRAWSLILFYCDNLPRLTRCQPVKEFRHFLVHFVVHLEFHSAQVILQFWEQAIISKGGIRTVGWVAYKSSAELGDEVSGLHCGVRMCIIVMEHYTFREFLPRNCEWPSVVYARIAVSIRVSSRSGI